MLEFIKESPELFIIICFIWVVFGVVIESMVAEEITQDYFIFSPKDFYENTRMNMFGSIACYFLLAVISPFGFFIKILEYIVINVWSAIEWLFTVGKRNH